MWFLLLSNVVHNKYANPRVQEWNLVFELYPAFSFAVIFLNVYYMSKCSFLLLTIYISNLQSNINIFYALPVIATFYSQQCGDVFRQFPCTCKLSVL